MKTLILRALAFLGLSVALIGFAAILIPVFREGLPGLSSEFLTQSPRMMGREGGILPLLVSTVLVNGFAVVFVLLIGLPTSFALALMHFKDSFSRSRLFLRRALDLLTGTPSIVFGLFGHAFFCRYLGLGYSILAGALTLSLMVLPTFVRFCEDAFGFVPREVWATSKSLGLSDQTFAWRILFPSSLAAITAALVLSWARAVAETAALLFTSGYSVRMPGSLLESGRTLSVHVYDLSMNVSGSDRMAYQSAVILILLSMCIGFGTRAVARLFRWRLSV